MKFKVFFVVLLLATLSTPSAHAADTGWRYWGYFQAAPGATKWTAAMTGPTVNVEDGSVEGWAFTFSSDAIPDAKAPKVAPSFSSICGKTKAVAGKKRIGVMVDFGSSVLRPKGESTPRLIQKCVVVDKSAEGVSELHSYLSTIGSELVVADLRSAGAPLHHDVKKLGQLFAHIDTEILVG